MFKTFFFSGSFIILNFFLFSCNSQKTATSDSSQHPNILFIAVDDMNDWVGFLGGHPGMDIQTPNIDGLAKSCLAFTNAHAASPVCCPSRVAVMTGVHPARSGIMHNVGGDGPVWRNQEALRDVETLEQFFKNRGYTTLGGGKLYHAQAPPWVTNSQVEAENWDFYFPSPYLTHPHQIRAADEVIYPEEVDNESRPGGRPGWWTWGPIDAEDEKMADYHVVEWASNELRRKHHKPFFLAAGIWKPHDPWEVPRRYFDMYPLEKIVLPDVKKDDMVDAFDHGRRNIHKWVLENDQWGKIIQAYAASMTFSDAMVGRLLKALEQSEYADNTIVVLWSDHGMHMGEKENFEKFTLWELSTRVPLLIKAPGMTKAGSRIDQPVSLLDIYPTLAELAGFEIPSHVDGNSLVPLIQHPAMERDPVISSLKIIPNKPWHIGPMFEPETGHAVRSRDYRYIFYTRTGFEELYDQRNDPNEWYNIAYKIESRKEIERHRKILSNLLPDLKFKAGVPDGYELKDGIARKTDFIQIPAFN